MKYALISDGNNMFPVIVVSLHPTTDPEMVKVCTLSPYHFSYDNRYIKKNIVIRKDLIFSSLEEAEIAAEAHLRMAVRNKTRKFLERQAFAKNLIEKINNGAALQAV